MHGLGTIINTLAIVAGGAGGALFGKFLKEDVQDTLTKCCGVSTLFIAITGALEQMLTVENGKIVSSGAMLVILSLTIGAVIGELADLEGAFERFGEWLKQKTGNAKDRKFVEAFVTASLTVCIGAMAIVGSIQDGITGDYSILATKAVLDLIIRGGYKGIGFDVIGLDPIADENLTRHKKLFEACDIVNIENLKNLDQCGSDLFWFSCYPLHLDSSDGSPIRAVAWFDA